METTLSGAALVGAQKSQVPSKVAALAAVVPIAPRLPDMATDDMRCRLPALDDDTQVGVLMEHVVPRDGEPDLRFKGTLLASAAPEFFGQDRWREYRVYRTAAGIYVFSKIGRSLMPGERDKFEAELWNQGRFLMKDGSWTGIGAEQLKDGVTHYFKFDPLAKQLYAKLDLDTSERID